MMTPRRNRRWRLTVEGLEARSLLSVVFSNYTTPTPNSEPEGITVGPGGNIWFTELEANQLGYIDPTTHAITEVTIPPGNTAPEGITLGPDGTLWFIAAGGDGQSLVDSYNPTTGAFDSTTLPNLLASGPITTGPDGNIWFAAANTIAALIPATHAVEAFPIPATPTGITTGPDGNIWFSYNIGTPPPLRSGYWTYNNYVGNINPTTDAISTYLLGQTLENSNAQGIAAGNDGDLWITGDGGVTSFNTTTFVSNFYPLPGASQGGLLLPDQAEPIALGTDNNVWFTYDDRASLGGLGVINETTDVINTFAPPGLFFGGLTLGPDGNMWFPRQLGSISEAQPLPSNTISGTVYNDLNANGSLDAGEPGLAGMTVYLDLKGDGKLDPGDPTATTDANGNYILTSPVYGTSTLRVVTYPGDTASGVSVTLVNGQITQIDDIGIINGSPILPLTPSASPFGTSPPNVATAEVTAIYNTIFGRAPDASGLAYWVSAVQAGVPLSQVATDFLSSIEYQSDVVASYYQGFLGRTGSAAEISGWVIALQHGVTETQVVADFLDSPEYSTLHPDNTSFAASLYENVLGRQGTTAEVSAWAQVLTSGTGRAQVVTDFLDSPEAATRAVVGDYLTILGRQLDASDLEFVTTALLSGSVSQIDLALILYGSQEFAIRAAAAV
jgi:streptogramin lyase